MKFSVLFLIALFGLSALATVKAECEINGDSLKSAIAAKTKSATQDIHICAVSDSVSVGGGYIETSVQYAPAGERFCMTEGEVFTSRVTVKGVCK